MMSRPDSIDYQKRSPGVTIMRKTILSKDL